MPDLRGLPDVASQTDSGQVELAATYHDTAGFDLLRAGITLRRRTGGSDAGWHLKIPVGPDSRTELRLPLGDERPPDEFTRLLTARLLGRPLRPVATITTTRHVTTLADKQGEPLAEVAFDRVIAESSGRTASLTRWDEVEVELADRAEDRTHLLKAADRSLRHAGLSRARRRTKLEEALAQSLPEPPPEVELTSKSSGREVLAAYLRAQFEELRTQDLRVRRDEPDSVHQMRVAARRMRGALQEYGRLLRPGKADRVISELRWLGRELGGPRDVEVLCELLLSQLDEVPGESVLGLVQARIAGHYSSVQASGTTDLRAALDSVRYVELLTTLESFVELPPTSAQASRRATDVMPALLNRSRRRVNRRMRRALAAPPGTKRDNALHEARKSAKRARYAAEVVSPVSGKKARKTAKSFKRLQSALGDHHDAVVAAGELRQLALRAYADGENAFTYGLLFERQAGRAAEFEKRGRHAWQQSRRSKRTAWMRG
jgi:CHAD domain-containing protein